MPVGVTKSPQESQLSQLEQPGKTQTVRWEPPGSCDTGTTAAHAHQAGPASVLGGGKEASVG